MTLIGREQRFHPDHSALERAYISLLGVPVVGLRIRTRNLLNLIPDDVRPRSVLDAGSGPGVITFALARRFPEADIVGVDLSDAAVAASRAINERAAFPRVTFRQGNLSSLSWSDAFDLITCVDILEHVEDDDRALVGLLAALRPGGTLVLHVPAYFRRYPFLKKTVNFDVPTHVRPGYEPAQILAKVEDAGFEVLDHGFTFGLLETLANNVGYMITRANKEKRELYALAFPWLNALAWLGRHARPRELGAGVFVTCRKPGRIAE